MKYLWEAEFVGVDINPLYVKSIKFPTLNYDETGIYEVEVEEIIDERITGVKPCIQ